MSGYEEEFGFGLFAMGYCGFLSSKMALWGAYCRV